MDRRYALSTASSRRWLALAAVIVVAVVTGCGHRGAIQGNPVGRPQWHPQPEVVLSSPMAAHPVPGWRLSVADIGIAEPIAHQPGAVRFVTNDDAPWSVPYIGSVSDRAYFMTSATSDDRRWWLTGIDVSDGRPLFAPVPLRDAAHPDCFINGPNRLLCLASGDTSTAWVIDAESGNVLYDGPTDLTLAVGHLGVVQAGDYAVAEMMDEGVYGIGDTANTTWFVPGDGSLRTEKGPTNFAASTLAAQTTGGRGSDRMVVFSLRDGKVLEPELPEDVEPTSAVVYPGGFAVQTTPKSQQPTPDVVWFFDNDGRQLGHAVAAGSLDTLSNEIPIVASSRTSTVYSNEGNPLVDVIGFDSGSGQLLLGKWFFVNETSSESQNHWQQYDLTDGSKGCICRSALSGLVGSDGTTAVFTDQTPSPQRDTLGVDIATCVERWRFTSAPGSFSRVWRAGTTLIELSDDGTELMSLVAPS